MAEYSHNGYEHHGHCDPYGRPLSIAPEPSYLQHFMPQHPAYTSGPMPYAHDQDMFGPFMHPMNVQGNVHGALYNAPVQGPHAMARHGAFPQQPVHRQPMPAQQAMPPTPPHHQHDLQRSTLPVQSEASTSNFGLPVAAERANTPKTKPRGASEKTSVGEGSKSLIIETPSGADAARQDQEVHDSEDEDSYEYQGVSDEADSDYSMLDADLPSSQDVKPMTRAAAKASRVAGQRRSSPSIGKKPRARSTARRGPRVTDSSSPSEPTTSGDQANETRKGRKVGPNDPDNIKIYHLRVDDLLSFDAIGNVMRGHYDSLNTPRKSDFSIAAVYGRFVRNAPRIAEAEGKTFTRAEYLYLFEDPDRNVKRRNGRVAKTHLVAQGLERVDERTLSPEEMEAALADFGPEFDEHLRMAYHETSQELWDILVDLMEERTGKIFEAEVLSRRIGMLIDQGPDAGQTIRLARF